MQREVYLYVENVTCSKPAPPFRVYLNVRPAMRPNSTPTCAWAILGRSACSSGATRRGRHAGNGMTFPMDITDAVARLTARKNWDGQHVRVSFSPGFWEGEVPQVKVGRVSLYYK